MEVSIFVPYFGGSILGPSISATCCLRPQGHCYGKHWKRNASDTIFSAGNGLSAQMGDGQRIAHNPMIFKEEEVYLEGMQTAALRGIL